MIWRNDNFGAAVIGIALVALWPRLTYLDEVEQNPFLEVPTTASMPYVEAARGEGKEAVASPLYPVLFAWLRRRRPSTSLRPSPTRRSQLCAIGSNRPRDLGAGHRTHRGSGRSPVRGRPSISPAPCCLRSLAVFLVLLLLAALLWTDRQSDGKAFLGVGILLALCFLAAPQVALFAPAVLWWLWAGGKQRVGWACALGTVCALALWYFGGVATSADGSPDLLVRGGEHLPALDMYHARGDSAVLAALLWKWGFAFPFGLVLPLALLGVGFCLGDAGAGRFARPAVCRNQRSRHRALRCPCRDAHGAGSRAPALCGERGRATGTIVLGVEGNSRGGIGASRRTGQRQYARHGPSGASLATPLFGSRLCGIGYDGYGDRRVRTVLGRRRPRQERVLGLGGAL